MKRLATLAIAAALTVGGSVGAHADTDGITPSKREVTTTTTTSPVVSFTRPALVAGSSWAYRNDVAATVEVSRGATIELVTEAYRHPRTVQARIITTGATTVTIRDYCKPIRLAHTWSLVVDGVTVARTTLNCN